MVLLSNCVKNAIYVLVNKHLCDKSFVVVVVVSISETVKQHFVIFTCNKHCTSMWLFFYLFIPLCLKELCVGSSKV